jgi:hypothetical protein
MPFSTRMRRRATTRPYRIRFTVSAEMIPCRNTSNQVDAVAMDATEGRTTADCFMCTTVLKSRAVATSSRAGSRCSTFVDMEGSAALNENITASQKPVRISVLR